MSLLIFPTLPIHRWINRGRKGFRNKSEVMEEVSGKSRPDSGIKCIPNWKGLAGQL